MTSFELEVEKLIEKIQAPESPECADSTTLHLLQKVQNCLESPRQQGLDAACACLRDHWLHSVAWCSDLSREIERILILFDEMIDDQNR